MNNERVSGVLLHPTSLPGPYGIGELGAEAYRFVDFLHDARQGIWQVLPLGPTGYGDSPYQSFSAFAGNPLLISIDPLLNEGLLSDDDLRGMPDWSDGRVDFGPLIEWKVPLLRKAYATFDRTATRDQRRSFERFRAQSGAWLDDFALFTALKQGHGGAVWTTWERELVAREPEALARWNQELAGDVQAHKFWQYLFFEQWRALKTYAQERGVRIMGDLPIYMAHDSADVWAHPELFHLDSEGNPSLMAGVPPDYFSETGQLWGNPIYRWDAMAETGYAWWIARMRQALTMLDYVRLDHFRGFEAYWEIPAGEETAVHGRWVEGPGAGLFEAIQHALGDLPIVAENLGIITAKVEALRRQFGLPGMAVLQFAFGTDPSSPGTLPHTYAPDTVAYTGTHDNDTTQGWWTSAGEGTTRSPEEFRKERLFAQAYLAAHHEPMHWAFIRGVLASVAGMAIVPMQDVLGLGTEARMNLPGSFGGNWTWRLKPGMLGPEVAQHLGALTVLYGRAPGLAPVQALDGRVG